MTIRLATYNVENLFSRAKAMNRSRAEGKPYLEDVSRLNELISNDKYSDKDKVEMLSIMKRNDGLLTKSKSEFIILQEIRGKLKKKPKSADYEIVPDGRADWVGWFELTPDTIEETSTENTARIINLLNADIMCMVEVEDRVVLKQFNDKMIPFVKGRPFEHVMLIDGNDERGIDVGIMAHEPLSIISIDSHVDDVDDKGIIFSRDCAEYTIKTPSGKDLLVMINHLKSKGYGAKSTSDAKRLRQSKRIREIYEARLSEGHEYIAIAGDFNDTPDSPALEPLLKDGSNLTDIMAHPNFSGDSRPGTYGNGTKDGKFDYILMSPALSAKVKNGGIERRGVWGGKNGTLFPHLPEIAKEINGASDHAALWVELDI